MPLLVSGEDLVLHKQYLGELGSILDPEGINVIDRHLLHSDTIYIRCFGMFKILNTYEPYEAMITLPADVFVRIMKEVDEDKINSMYENIH